MRFNDAEGGNARVVAIRFGVRISKPGALRSTRLGMLTE